MRVDHLPSCPIIGDESYQEDGSVLVNISVDSDKVDEFKLLVLDLTSGSVIPEKV